MRLSPETLRLRPPPPPPSFKFKAFPIAKSVRVSARSSGDADGASGPNGAGTFRTPSCSEWTDASPANGRVSVGAEECPPGSRLDS